MASEANQLWELLQGLESSLPAQHLKKYKRGGKMCPPRRSQPLVAMQGEEEREERRRGGEEERKEERRGVKKGQEKTEKE